MRVFFGYAAMVACTLMLAPLSADDRELRLPDFELPEFGPFPELDPDMSAPFTLIVPVTVRELHHTVTGVEVICQVYYRVQEGGRSSQEVVARGFAIVPYDPDTRAFDGTVTVYARPMAHHRRAFEDGNYYICALNARLDSEDRSRLISSGSEEIGTRRVELGHALISGQID